MPVPKHIFDPPFNIIRSSHVVLDVVDLDVVRYGEKKGFKVKLGEPPNDLQTVASNAENSAPLLPLENSSPTLRAHQTPPKLM